MTALDPAEVADAIVERLQPGREPDADYTVNELATYFAISERTVRRMIARRDLASRKVGTRRLIPRTAVHEYIAAAKEREARECEDRRRVSQPSSVRRPASQPSPVRRPASQPRPRNRCSRAGRRRATVRSARAPDDGPGGEPPPLSRRPRRGWRP